MSTPLRDAMAAASEAAALPSSPFLDSDPTQPPRLRRVDVPTVVVAEAQQQNSVVTVQLPFGTQRAGQSVRVRVPYEGRASLAYRAAFDGFMTVNCLSAPRTADEAERVLVAEEVELIHAFRKMAGVDDSAEPRGVCLQLIFPANLSNGFAAHELVDAMAALADTCGSFGDRTVRSVRFSLYGGKAAAPAERVLARDALDRREASGVALVLRWAEAGPDGEPRVRAECASVNATNTRAGQRSSMLQSVAIKMALAHCVAMPAAFFYPAAPENARDFETKYKLACDRFHAYSDGTMTEPPAENPLLTSVDRVFLRITPKSRGLAGVVESGAVHALLLCADGQAAQARAFALKHREGLPFEDEEGLLLHALGTRVEQVHLGAAVSMYGSGGKPGEPIRPPRTWVWRRVSLFVPLKLLQRTFYVMSCSADSVLPGKNELTPFANSHFKTVFDASALVTGVAVGNADVPAPPMPCPTAQAVGSDEDTFLALALGIDLDSRRTLLGDAIAHLSRANAPRSLVELLIMTGLRVGMRSSLEEAFSACLGAVRDVDASAERHERERKRLKIAADVALVGAAANQASAGIAHVPREKIRMLCKALKRKAACNVTIRNASAVPRDFSVVRSLSTCVVSSCRNTTVNADEAGDEVEVVLTHYVDVVAAVAKAMRVFCAQVEVEAECFVVVHSSNFECASVNRVLPDGRIRTCGVGQAFEADDMARLVCVKFVGERDVVVTALVGA